MGDRLVDQFISLVSENTNKVEKFNFEKEGDLVTLSVTVNTKVKSKEDKVTVDVKTTRVETPAKSKVEKKVVDKEEKPVPVKKPRVKKEEPKATTEVKKKTRTKKVQVDHTGDAEIDFVEVKEKPVRKPRTTKAKKETEEGPWKYDVVSGNFIHV